jgi:ABC-type polar amino acid transport system ATPase subunit
MRRTLRSYLTARGHWQWRLKRCQGRQFLRLAFDLSKKAALKRFDTAMREITELSQCSYNPLGKGNGLHEVCFRLAPGDSYALSADLPDDGHLFFRALATLNSPACGAHYYHGGRLDFSDYRNLLPYKRQVGYISQDVALIGNRSIHENLILMRSYFENLPTPELEPETMALCRYFHLENKLELRPAELNRGDLKLAVIIRELAKSPEILLVERPRDFLTPGQFTLFKQILRERRLSGVPLVFLSSDEAFTSEFSNKKARINKGTLESHTS